MEVSASSNPNVPHTTHGSSGASGPLGKVAVKAANEHHLTPVARQIPGTMLHLHPRIPDRGVTARSNQTVRNHGFAPPVAQF